MSSIVEKVIQGASNIGMFAATAFCFSFFKWVLQPKHIRCLKCFAINVTIGIAVGVLSGMAALEMGYKEFTSLLISSVATYVSRDMMEVILEKEFIKKILTKKLEK